MHETVLGKIPYWLAITSPALPASIGILDLRRAAAFGSRAGLSLVQVYHACNNNFDIGWSYSGVYLKAIGNLEVAMLGFGSAFILSILAWGHHRTKKSNQRILQTLKSQGFIND